MQTTVLEDKQILFGGQLQTAIHKSAKTNTFVLQNLNPEISWDRSVEESAVSIICTQIRSQTTEFSKTTKKLHKILFFYKATRAYIHTEPQKSNINVKKSFSM